MKRVPKKIFITYHNRNIRPFHDRAKISSKAYFTLKTIFTKIEYKFPPPPMKLTKARRNLCGNRLYRILSESVWEKVYKYQQKFSHIATHDFFKNENHMH